MLTAEQLEERRQQISEDPVLRALLRRVRGRVDRILREMPPVPAIKALLSRDGGLCPDDRSQLTFDPWSPRSHRCPACGREVTGERHDGHWARAQHLWLAERAADLATLAVLEEDPAAGQRAADLLLAQAEVYRELPNQDNVLGPTHLFFSTYLESMWITSWLAAAFLLREAGLLPEETAGTIDQVAEEAAALIGEFNEGLSNRQVWHAAALTALAAWFGDEELAQNAIESRTGLLGLLADGFEGEEAMWWEGENYHLFALRGVMVGLHWARTNNSDLLEDPELSAHFANALLAPALTALPDLTFPARKDSRYGMSLAQPAFLELWEIGRSWLPDQRLDGWLNALYAVPPPRADHYDAWLHNTGQETPAVRSAADLSWWALLVLAPNAERDPEAVYQAESRFIKSQGLAVLRRENRYASLECGVAGGGHGHPDRLHLTLHAEGVHWLPDPGTGSYVDQSLFWYRGVRAHNAPALDGEGLDEAWCEAFDTRADWGWTRGRAGGVKRTVIAGPELILDLVEMEVGGWPTFELPWHLQGESRVVTEGSWEPAELDDPAIHSAELFQPAGGGPLVIESSSGDARLRLHLAGDAQLLRATALGLPPQRSFFPFFLQRTTASLTRLTALLELAPQEGTALKPTADAIVVERQKEPIAAFAVTASGIQLSTLAGKLELGGLRPPPPKATSLFRERPSWDAMATAAHAWSHPALDGTLEGFDLDYPLTLDGEHQYRRSEQPYDPERFAAEGWVNWDPEGIYVGVQVNKPEVVTREAGAAPLELDNEADDIHLDGIQLYLKWPDDDVAAWVVVPDLGGGIRVRSIQPVSETEITGGWTETGEGYILTVGLRDPRISTLRAGNRLGFDLLVNEMTSDRVRRLGQLVWSGGNGWVYLRGDRHSPDHFGVLELG